MHRRFDEDHNGLLDMEELKMALASLRTISAAADEEVAQLQKETTAMWKSAKAAHAELKKTRLADEEAEREKAEAEARAKTEEAALAEKSKAAKQAKAAEVKRKKEEEKAKYDAKIKALRGSVSADTAASASAAAGEAPALAAAAPALAPLKLILTGAPASGKGTQAERIIERYGVVHLSTGDILRANAKAATPLGVQVEEFMSAGELVPDELVISLVVARLGESDCAAAGWMLDGFPRTAGQAASLRAAGMEPDVTLCLDVPDDVLVDRVCTRRLDPVTGQIYNVRSLPADEEVVSRLTQRPDDTEPVARKRLATYYSNVESLKAACTRTCPSPRSLLRRSHRCAALPCVCTDPAMVNFDGNRDPSDVFSDVCAAITAAAAVPALQQTAPEHPLTTHQHRSTVSKR